MKIFLLSLLGMPIYIWLFSIIYQLDKKTSDKKNNLKHLLIGLITLYPILYLFIFIALLFSQDLAELMVFIKPYHFLAMFCGFLLMLFGANSYGKYEKKKGLKTFDSFGVFFMLWLYIFGIWSLQPILNKYVN